MRILHICQRDDPDTGGSLRVAEALVLEQRKVGVESWLVFLYGPPSSISADLMPYTVCLGLESSKQAAQGIIRLRKTIRRIAPDIIHSHDGILWPRLVFILLRIPVVMHAHLPVSKAQHPLFWSLIRKTTDLLIGISRPTIESWVSAGYPAGKIRFIPNGVDVNRFSPIDEDARRALRLKLGLPVDKRVLLWLGRLHRSMKGVDRIERISTILPEDTVLVVVGNGPAFEEIQSRCADVLRQRKMIMTGTTREPQKYYSAADAFLFTSHYEPFGLVILEAVASGVPILSFPVDCGGGAAELLEQFGVCEVGDTAGAAEIKDALEKVLQGKASAEKLRAVVEAEYSWEEKSRDVMVVYRELLGLQDRQPIQDPKVLVCQHGARHRYAIPRMLNKRNILAAFYTDSSAESLIGKLVQVLGEGAPASWRNYARWNISGVPKSKISSTDSSLFYELGQRFQRKKKVGIQLYHQRHKILSSRMCQWGLNEANLIYSMYHENLSFVRWAKDRGALSVVDVFVSPVTEQIMESERKAYAGWEDAGGIDSGELEEKLWQETAVLADMLICPSEWVADGVRTASPHAAGKIKVVPYGCSINYEGRINHPVKGRIFFAGRDPLRKGLHYLSQAATQLKSVLPDVEVRVAGEIPAAVVQDSLCKDIHFLGQLVADEMKNEYLSADVFILPALSEGFAGVVAEAIGAGCPVIVTREAGSPIVHEREGLIVPSRDVNALVDAVERIVEDRNFRDRCAEACLAQRSFYSEESWAERLCAAIEELSGA